MNKNQPEEVFCFNFASIYQLSVQRLNKQNFRENNEVKMKGWLTDLLNSRSRFRPG